MLATSCLVEVKRVETEGGLAQECLLVAADEEGAEILDDIGAETVLTKAGGARLWRERSGAAGAVDFWVNVSDEAGAGVMVAVAAGTEGTGIETIGFSRFASLSSLSFLSLDCWRVNGRFIALRAWLLLVTSVRAVVLLSSCSLTDTCLSLLSLTAEAEKVEDEEEAFFSGILDVSTPPPPPASTSFDLAAVMSLLVLVRVLWWT